MMHNMVDGGLAAGNGHLLDAGKHAWHCMAGGTGAGAPAPAPAPAYQPGHHPGGGGAAAGCMCQLQARLHMQYSLHGWLACKQWAWECSSITTHHCGLSRAQLLP